MRRAAMSQCVSGGDSQAAMGSTREMQRDLGGEPGRKQVGGSGGEEGALEFLGGVAAGFEARLGMGFVGGFGVTRGAESDYAGEGEPFAAARALEEAAAIA